MQRYRMEFILDAKDTCVKTLKNSLVEFCDGLEVTVNNDLSTPGQSFRIAVSTDDPTIIFDICGQFGRIRSVKADLL